MSLFFFSLVGAACLRLYEPTMCLPAVRTLDPNDEDHDAI
jgi:hypothetical protein